MTTPAITVRHVSKQFGETRVLNDITLEVQPGRVTSLIGPSGSGKSTLLRCMAYLEEPTTGSILIEGTPLGRVEGDGPPRRQSASELRRTRSKIGMVFQQFNLWPHMTALGNVSAALRRVRKQPRKQAEERAMAQLEKVGLAERAHHYPAELSGGQQQRVAIARALALDPTIMLFDEPTSALDPELTGEVLNVMRQLADEGMTMVVVTHEIGFAASVCNEVCFLDAGKLEFRGPPDEVFAAPRHPRLEQFLDTYLDRGAAMLK